MNESKICPVFVVAFEQALISTGFPDMKNKRSDKRGVFCIKEQCAWWVERPSGGGCCAMVNGK